MNTALKKPAPGGDDGPREFAFSAEDFNALRALVHQVTGISLAENKRNLAPAIHPGSISRSRRPTSIRMCWPAPAAEDGQQMVPGHVYIAPRDRHLGDRRRAAEEIPHPMVFQETIF